MLREDRLPQRCDGHRGRAGREDRGVRVMGELLGRATAVGVTFVRGTDFGGTPSTARLAFTYVSPEEIREGVATLASLVPSAARL